MAYDYPALFNSIKQVADYQREAEEFELRKRQAQQQAAGPASVQEWQYYSNLPAESQQEYLRMKRADQIMNLGGTMGVRNPLGGGLIESYNVTPKPEDMPAFKGAQQTAVNNANIAVKPIENKIDLDAEKAKSYQDFLQNQLPGARAKVEQAKKTIATMRGPEGQGLAPDVQAVVGWRNLTQGAVPFTQDPDNPTLPRTIAGTPAASGSAKIKQAQGQIFLEAYESLKGAGALTNIEGAKGEQARARLSAAQTEQDFDIALKELSEVLDSSMARLNAKEAEANQFINTMGQSDPLADIPRLSIDDLSPDATLPQTNLMSPEVNATIFNAQKALKAGAPPDQVRQRLIDNGIDPSKVGL